MTMSKILRDAAALVRKGWTQGTAARDRAGSRVWFASENAVCWCPYGAMARIANGFDIRPSAEALLDHVGLPKSAAVGEWNDSLPPGSGELVAATMEAAADAMEVTA